MAAEQEAVAQLLAEGAVEEEEQCTQRRNPSRGRVIAGGLLVTCGVLAGACGVASVARGVPTSTGLRSGSRSGVVGKADASLGIDGNGKASVMGQLLSTLEQSSTAPDTGNTSACHWIEMKQHDFPERSDIHSVEFKHYKSVEEVKRFAEKEGYVGFSLHKDVAYMKGGENAPRSWKDLLWMGKQYKVDFYLCERDEVSQKTQEHVAEAMKLVDGYIRNKTKAVEDQWVTVHALPEDEGTSMGFDNGHDCTVLADFKVLCAANPDCVGFVHNPSTKQFFAKRKWSGFDARTAKYYQKEEKGWEWHYIKSRGEDPAVNPQDSKPFHPAHPQHHGFTVATVKKK